MLGKHERNLYTFTTVLTAMGVQRINDFQCLSRSCRIRRAKGCPMIRSPIFLAMTLTASMAFAQNTPECDAGIHETSRIMVEQMQAKNAYETAKKERKLDEMRERAAFAKTNADALDASLEKQKETCKAFSEDYRKSMSDFAHKITQELEAP
jgi:hypothetical protein